MGIGIFAVWPLAKKFGKRNVTAAGFVLYAIGSAVCWLFPTNMTIMLVGQFIKTSAVCPAPMFSRLCLPMSLIMWSGKTVSAATE